MEVGAGHGTLHASRAFNAIVIEVATSLLVSPTWMTRRNGVAHIGRALMRFINVDKDAIDALDILTETPV